KEQADRIPDITSLLFTGGVDANMIGAVNHGSIESNIAQRAEVFKSLDNLVNGGGDKITFVTVSGEDGNPIKIPYVGEDGNLVFPNDEGVVRSINGGYLARWKEINDQVEDKIDDVMEFCIISDDLARFVLGLSEDRWNELCAVGGGEDIGMSKELAKLECDMTYIKSLPSGSISQTQALSKLRFIVRKHLRNVNIKNLISKEKMKADMKSGNLHKGHGKNIDFDDNGVKPSGTAPAPASL
ncbi:MAG: hypothetical protein Q8J97_05555, partial [Flavobacteriaceae bacterium]|nr:hypothetical protein [Flavobacteriaceae bacterium]